ncbi:MAG: SE1561 family protein [Bacillota bacterium]|nr:SE1561 family protein [Bacillota bacterium]
MGTAINDKNKQIDFLKQKLNMFLDMLDAIDPEDTGLEDIDRMIEVVDELESKCREFNHRESE